MARRDFLTARWVNVVLLTYHVGAEILRRRLPPGCELDRWHGQEGFVSLVAFDFLETRVKGIGWPLLKGMRNFPEINLRFYVRQTGGPQEGVAEGEDRRGVCFVREFVPSRAVAGVARWVYNEPYRATRMRSQVHETADELAISHQLSWGGKEHRLEVRTGKSLRMPAPESVEHFFKEHQWGFGVDRAGRRVRYEVVHPAWEVRDVKSWRLEWDWAAVYGQEWSVLQDAVPLYVMVAAGSAVRVRPMSNE